MPKWLLTTADIRTWKACGEMKIDLAPCDSVSPEAEAVAEELGIALVPRISAAPENTPLDQRTASARGAEVRVELEPFSLYVKRPDMNRCHVSCKLDGTLDSTRKAQPK